MKALFNLTFVALIALGLSGCGDKKGGQNETGVEANGKCSGNVMSDAETYVKTATEAAGRMDIKAASVACDKFVNKYGKTMMCISPQTGRTLDMSTVADSCDTLRKSK